MSSPLALARSAWRVAARDPGFLALGLLAWVLLIASRGAITALSLRQIVSALGETGQETPRSGLVEGDEWRSRRIRRVISRVSPHTPTTSNCYPQALAAHLLLRAWAIPHTVYHGAVLDPDGGGLLTHVWVRAGRIVVTGGPQHLGFGALSATAWRPRATAIDLTAFSPQGEQAGGTTARPA